MARKRELGNVLGRIAYQRTLTDSDLARRTAISRAQVNRIRNGRTIPRVSTAMALAAALGCRVHEIFFLRGPGSGP